MKPQPPLQYVGEGEQEGVFITTLSGMLRPTSELIDLHFDFGFARR
jgi:hypothetical protein